MKKLIVTASIFAMTLASVSAFAFDGKPKKSKDKEKSCCTAGNKCESKNCTTSDCMKDGKCDTAKCKDHKNCCGSGGNCCAPKTGDQK